MKVKVGLVGHGVMSSVMGENGKPVEKFIADTVTIYLDGPDANGKPNAETENMHEGNYIAVALAIARKRLQTEVFPVDIEKAKWLPARPVKKGSN
jgi:hypothetical protein